MVWVSIALAAGSLGVAVLSLLLNRRTARRVGASAVAAESVRRIMTVCDEATRLEQQIDMGRVDGATPLAWMQFERTVRQLGAMLQPEARGAAAGFSMPSHELLAALRRGDDRSSEHAATVGRLMLQFLRAFLMRCVIARESGATVLDPSLPTHQAISESVRQ